MGRGVGAELCVGASLHCDAVAQDDDLIRTDNSAEPVCNHNGRLMGDAKRGGPCQRSSNR